MDETKALNKNITNDTGTERGEIFSSLTASITNVGGGSIGIFVQARMFEKVSVQLDISLQRYEETPNSAKWNTVDSYSESYTDVSVATFSKIVSGFKTDCKYRVRATVDGPGFNKTATSNGVLIKDGPA